VKPIAVHDGRDLFEGHPEHFVEHERESFRRLQLLEDDEQRQTDRVGDHGVRLGGPSWYDASQRSPVSRS
jgi:hypothetical protein